MNPSWTTTKTTFALLLAGLLEIACSGAPPRTERDCIRDFRNPVLNRCKERRPVDGVPWHTGKAGTCGLSLADRARAIKKKPVFRIGDQRFTRDCVGYVQSVLVAEGFPLRRLRPRGRKGGVGLLHHMADELGLLHTRELPRIGDVVFFDNTWDHNHNGKLDDPLTHVGLVIGADPDGTVTYLHRGSKGITTQKLNRRRPGERRDPETRKELNSYLRRRGYAGNKLRLSGQLFRDYASLCLYRVPIVALRL